MKTAIEIKDEIAASHYDVDTSQLQAGEQITEGVPIGYLTGACDPADDLLRTGLEITYRDIVAAYAELVIEHGGLPRGR